MIITSYRRPIREGVFRKLGEYKLRDAIRAYTTRRVNI